MKKTNKKSKKHKITIIDEPSDNLNDDLREEYNLNELELKPNPYVNKDKKISIELLPDVAKFFRNSKQVNEFLRNQIKQFQKVMM
jgi:hypothetical protein